MVVLPVAKADNKGPRNQSGDEASLNCRGILKGGS